MVDHALEHSHPSHTQCMWMRYIDKWNETAKEMRILLSQLEMHRHELFIKIMVIVNSFIASLNSISIEYIWWRVLVPLSNLSWIIEQTKKLRDNQFKYGWIFLFIKFYMHCHLYYIGSRIQWHRQSNFHSSCDAFAIVFERTYYGNCNIGNWFGFVCFTNCWIVEMALININQFWISF